MLEYKSTHKDEAIWVKNYCTVLTYHISLTNLYYWYQLTCVFNTVKAMAYKRTDKTIDSDYSNHGKNYTI